jgi:hypothetical protein
MTDFHNLQLLATVASNTEILDQLLELLRKTGIALTQKSTAALSSVIIFIQNTNFEQNIFEFIVILINSVFELTRSLTDKRQFCVNECPLQFVLNPNQIWYQYSQYCYKTHIFAPSSKQSPLDKLPAIETIYVISSFAESQKQKQNK